MLTAFAGRCLALIGPLAPEKIAFNYKLHVQESQLPSETSIRTGIVAETSSVVKQVLQQLTLHVIDEDPYIVNAAQSTLRQVSS